MDFAANVKRDLYIIEEFWDDPSLTQEVNVIELAFRLLAKPLPKQLKPKYLQKIVSRTLNFSDCQMILDEKLPFLVDKKTISKLKIDH